GGVRAQASCGELAVADGGRVHRQTSDLRHLQLLGPRARAAGLRFHRVHAGADGVFQPSRGSGPRLVRRERNCEKSRSSCGAIARNYWIAPVSLLLLDGGAGRRNFIPSPIAQAEGATASVRPEPAGCALSASVALPGTRPDALCGL